VDVYKQLQRSLLLFYTGRQRSASDVLTDQRSAVRDGTAVADLKKMRDLAHELRERLGAGDISSLGRLLHENWELKRGLTGGISDDTVDAWYEHARTAGATGGKILGAGAGGFLLMSAPPERQDAVRGALADLRELPLRFAARGTHISVLGRD
jgi:D-glycero-alpha-D-manno-heptose-7-phosphate kinase